MPALAGHLDSPVHMVQLWNRVRVRIDAQHAAELKRRLVPAPIQAQPQWMRVDLDDYVVLRAGPQHLFNVDLIAWPPLELPPVMWPMIVV